MLSDIITTEMIWEGIWQGMEPFVPIFSSVVVAWIVWGIIKVMIRNVVYDFSRLIGNNKRKAKKDARTAENIIDVVSIISDIAGNKKA